MNLQRSSLINLFIRLLPFLVILAISLIALRQVLFTPGLLLYGDFTSAPSLQMYFTQFYPQWNDYGSFPVFADTGLWFIGPATAIALLLHIPAEWFFKLLVLGVMLLSGLSMYYAANILIKEVVKNWRIAFIASITAALVYMLNPWVYPHITHLLFWAGYALAPIVLVCFMKALQSGKLTYVIATALLWSFAALIAHWVAFIGILILSWLGFSLLYQFKAGAKSKVLSNVKVTALTVVFFLAFNAFWLISHLASGQIIPGYLVTTDALDFISRNGSLLNAIRFMGFWEPSSMEFYEPSSKLLYYPWLIGSFAVPLFAFASLLLVPKIKSALKHVLYFSLMTIPLIFLGMGMQSPFPSAYNWLVFDVPFFSESFGWMLRESDKWVGLLALMFCFLIAFTVAGILQTGWKNPMSVKRGAMLIVIPLLFVSSFALFITPAAGTWLSDRLNSVKVPEEFQVTNDWVEGQSGDFKVMWLPQIAGETTWGPGILSRMFYVWTLPAKTTIVGDARATPSMEYYLNYIYYESLLHNQTACFSRYLDPLNTRYVLIHDDMTHAHEEVSTAINNLEKQNDLSLIGQDGFISIFENEGYAPHIFIPSQNLVILGGLDMVTPLTAIEAFDPTSTALIYLDQAFSSNYPNAEGIVLSPRSDINDIALAQVADRYLIAPFDYTDRFSPREAWSKLDIMTWHLFWGGVPNIGSESWDFDYGKGLVTTYDYRPTVGPVPPYHIETGDATVWQTAHNTGNEDINTSSDGESLIIDYTFYNESSLSVYAQTYFEPENWASHNTRSLWVYGDGSGNYLDFFYYQTNRDGSISPYGLKDYTLNWVGWKQLSFPLPDAPRDNVNKFLIAVSWDIYKSPSGLGSHTIMVKDIVMSGEHQPPRQTLVMPVQVQEGGQHELYVRVLENPGGGEVTVYIDAQKTATMPTQAQEANFVWKKVGTVELSKGSHSITLENTYGFNAVNVLALLPPDVAQGYFDSAQQFLEAERIIHILEGERDFEYENGEISSSWGGNASRGETLILNRPHPLFAPSGTIETGIATTMSMGHVFLWQTAHNTENEHINTRSDGESLFVDYTFDNESSLSIYAQTYFEPENWEDYDTLSLQVYGDGTGNNLNFWYQQDGTWHGMGGCNLDWEGEWRELSFTIPPAARDKVAGFMIALSWDINKSQQGLGSHTIVVGDIRLLLWQTAHNTENEHINISSDGESLVIDYTFDNESSLSVYAQTYFEPENWEDYDTLSLYVYGDGTGNNLNFWYQQDSAWYGMGDCTLDWAGEWRELSFAIPEAAQDNFTGFMIALSWDINKSQQGLGSHTIAVWNIGLSLEHTSEASTTIHTLRDSLYKIGVRALTGPGYKPIVLQIDEKSVEINLAGAEEGLKWVYSEPIALQKGEHSLEILPKGKCEIDSITVFSTNSDETLEDIFTANDSPATITRLQAVSATKYIAHVNAQRPFMLAFAESYNPEWVAKVNGREYHSEALYGVINGFWIDSTGELEITIEYEPQHWFDIGAIISGVSLVGALGYVVWDWRRKKGKGSKPGPKS